jgi:hypothetical protein
MLGLVQVYWKVRTSLGITVRVLVLVRLHCQIVPILYEYYEYEFGRGTDTVMLVQYCTGSCTRTSRCVYFVVFYSWLDDKRFGLVPFVEEYRLGVVKAFNYERAIPNLWLWLD